MDLGPGAEASFIWQHMAALLLSSSPRDGHSSPGSDLQGPPYSPSLLFPTETSGTPEREEETSRGGPTLSCLPLLITLDTEAKAKVPFLPTLVGPLLAVSRYLTLAQHTSRLDALS